MLHACMMHCTHPLCNNLRADSPLSPPPTHTHTHNPDEFLICFNFSYSECFFNAYADVMVCIAWRTSLTLCVSLLIFRHHRHTQSCSLPLRVFPLVYELRVCSLQLLVFLRFLDISHAIRRFLMISRLRFCKTMCSYLLSNELSVLIFFSRA